LNGGGRSGGSLIRARRLAALALVLVAAAMLLVRLPDASRELDGQAVHNAAGGDLGRMLATADTIDVDNDFVVGVQNDVPVNATYTVQLPPDVATATARGIGALTMAALPGYIRFLLLPRRETAPAEAQYIICYACDVAKWDGTTTWVWEKEKAILIGRLNHG
jgi:hypothetical protein